MNGKSMINAVADVSALSDISNTGAVLCCAVLTSANALECAFAIATIFFDSLDWVGCTNSNVIDIALQTCQHNQILPSGGGGREGREGGNIGGTLRNEPAPPQSGSSMPLPPFSRRTFTAGGSPEDHPRTKVLSSGGGHKSVTGTSL